MPFLTQGKTNWKFIGIVVVLAVIAGAGIFWWSYSNPIPICGTPLIPKQDETADLVPSEVEGWQTYRNEEYGFEIKHPEDLIISVDDRKITFKLKKEDHYGPVSIWIFNNPKDYTVEEFYNFYTTDTSIKGLEIMDKEIGGHIYYNPYKTSHGEIEEVEIDGIIATKFPSVFAGEVIPYTFFAITDNNVLVEIGTNDDENLLGQMLSTFRFIEIMCGKENLPTEISANLEFQKYIGELIEANPELKIGDFECVRKKITSYGPHPGPSGPEVIWMFSPDGAKAVTTLISLGEPDSDLRIYNRNGDQKEETLGFCGTPCGWANAFWLNNEQFIAIFSSEYFGTEKVCDVPAQCHGTTCYTTCYTYRIELYDLSKNTVAYYYFPELFKSHLKNPWWKEQCEKVFGVEDIFCK